MRRRIAFFAVLLCLTAGWGGRAPAETGTLRHRELPQLANWYDMICALPDGGAMIANNTEAEELRFIRLDPGAGIVFDKTVPNFSLHYSMEIAAGGDHVAICGNGLALFDLEGNFLWEAPWAEGQGTTVLVLEDGLLVGIGTRLCRVGLDGNILWERDLAPEAAYSGRIRCIKQAADGGLLIGGSVRMLLDGYGKEEITRDAEGDLYLPDGSYYDLPSVAWVVKASPEGVPKWTYWGDPGRVVEFFDRVLDLAEDGDGSVLATVEGRDEGYYLAYLRRLDGETGELTGNARCDLDTNFAVASRFFAWPDGTLQVMGMVMPYRPNATRVVPDGGVYAYDPGDSGVNAAVATLPEGALTAVDFIEFPITYPTGSVNAEGILWILGSDARGGPVVALRYGSPEGMLEE